MSNTKKSVPSVSKSVQDQLDSCTSVAARVRFLSSQGMSRGDISRVLGIRYQWVRNVLITPLKNG
jgi:hypothetical protein